MRWVVLALAIAGCYRPDQDATCALACTNATECPVDFVCTNNRCATSEGACDVTGDASVDGPTVSCAGRPDGFDPDRCFANAQPQDLGGIKIDTDVDTDNAGFCDPTATLACYVIGNPLIVSGKIEASGSRPLVLWSGSTIIVGGTIDVGSHLDGLTGPAANPMVCDVIDGPVTMMAVPSLGAGGAGGSAHFRGGAGGGARSGTAGVPATATATVIDAGLFGGCRGGQDSPTAMAVPVGGRST